MVGTLIPIKKNPMQNKRFSYFYFRPWPTDPPPPGTSPPISTSIQLEQNSCILGIQNKKYRIQNKEYIIQNTESRIQNTDCRIQTFIYIKLPMYLVFI
jgi:hypothetical protein